MISCCGSVVCVGVGCGSSPEVAAAADCCCSRARQRFCYCGFAEAGQGGRPFFRSGGAWLIAEGSRCSGRCGARGRGRGCHWDNKWGVVSCGVGVRVRVQVQGGGVCCSCCASGGCGCCCTCTTFFQLLLFVVIIIAARVPIFVVVWRRAGVTHASNDPPRSETRDQMHSCKSVCVCVQDLSKGKRFADSRLGNCGNEDR